MIKKLNEAYDKPYMIADEKGSVYTFSWTKLEEISDLASKEVLNRVGKYLTRNNNKGSADSTLYDLLSDAKASLVKVNEYVKRYDKTNNESKSRTRKRSIKEGARKPQYYDPELEQFEIFLMTSGREGQDEIRDYVDSRRNTGIFGSVGSEYNNISVWVNTEDIDDTFVDEVEDLIIFAQEHGARINVPCYNQLKDLFTIKHAPYDI